MNNNILNESLLEENEDLVDIRTVKIDTKLPKKKKIESYIHQIKNPYKFKYGNMIIQIYFTETEITLDDRLKQYIRMVE